MAQWFSTIKIKHLFTEKEDHQSVQESMSKVADVLSRNNVFITGFDITIFRNIPKGDEIFKPVDYANKMLDMMYNFADAERIWVE